MKRISLSTLLGMTRRQPIGLAGAAAWLCVDGFDGSYGVGDRRSAGERPQVLLIHGIHFRIRFIL